MAAGPPCPAQSDPGRGGRLQMLCEQPPSTTTLSVGPTDSTYPKKEDAGSLWHSSRGTVSFPVSSSNPFGPPVLDGYLHCPMMRLSLGCLILRTLQPHWPSFKGSLEVPCPSSPQGLCPAALPALSPSDPRPSSCAFPTTLFLLRGGARRWE